MKASNDEELIDKTRYVYVLLDPRTQTPFYVGQARCVISRIGDHLNQNPHYNPKLEYVFSELKRLQLLPSFRVLEVANKDNVVSREKFYIEQYFTLYPGLCNFIHKPKSTEEKRAGRKQLRAERLASIPNYTRSLQSDSNTFND